ncbi:MAG: hypothetical protein AAGA39_06005 [Pseudomonadota bacterium]
MGLLIYYLVIAAVLGVWFGLYRLWRKRIDEDAAAGAAFEFERLGRQDPGLVEGLGLPDFTAIYARVVTPRAPGHVFAAASIFLLFVPIILGMTSIVIEVMERTGVIPQPAAAAQQIKLTADGIKLVREADLDALQYILQGWGGFFFFFSLLLFWVGVFVWVMRRFHSQRPGSLRDEILRAR